MYDEVVEIAAGEEALFIAPSDPSQDGIKEVVATFAPQDTVYPASSESTYISGEEREKLLLINGTAQDERFLRKVLDAQSYQLDSVVTGGRRVSTLEPFEKYSAVVLNNVALRELPREVGSQMETYVKQGGGFIMLGGNKSFGLGGYRHTVIEEILPVELVPPQREKKRLNVAVALVLDKSGSMKSQSKIAFARLAAVRVVDSLRDQDYFALIGFEDTPFIVMKIGLLRDIRAVAKKRTELLWATGTTNLLPALDVAKRQLERVPAGRKHMIVMTDGRLPDGISNRAYYLKLVEEMRYTGITVSTFLIGSDQDIILRDMARVGGGAFHRTRNAATLPELFLQDIRVSTGERNAKRRTAVRCASW